MKNGFGDLCLTVGRLMESGDVFRITGVCYNMGIEISVALTG